MEYIVNSYFIPIILWLFRELSKYIKIAYLSGAGGVNFL